MLGTVGPPRAGRARAALCVVLGLVTFPIGVGLGLPYLAKTGLSPATWLGLTLGIVGSVLLVAGTVGFLRSYGGWGRFVVTLPLVLIAVLLATAVGGQAVALTRVPPTFVGATTPAAFGLDYEDVEFPTPQGQSLSGWYVPSRHGAAVLLLHGAGSTRSAVVRHAQMLADNGFGVLLFDARGHGRSDGAAMDAGWYGDDDVRGAVSFVAARSDVDPARIGAVGLSMGGEEAIGALAVEPRLGAIVAEGATNRVADDKQWLSEVYGWRGVVTEFVGRLVYGTADPLTAADPPIPLREAVARAPETPVLLIAAGTDPDESHAARSIATGSPSSVQIWVAPAAGHVGALATHPAECEQRVSEFLARSFGVG